MGEQFLSFDVGKSGKQYYVTPCERFKNEEGSELSRWVPSKRRYFDSLNEALAYVEKNEGSLVD